MPDDPRLGVLLARRQEMQQRGETVCLEDLCRDCPELLPTLRESLERGEATPDVPPTLDQDGAIAPDTAPPTLMNQAAPDASPPTVLRAGDEPAAPARRSAVLPRVPGYDVVGELGRGGMGVVYKARHLRLNRLVALKMVLAGAHASPQQLIRFQIEAQSVASLHHPNIVQVYDDGVHDDCPYLALEFVEGGSLDRKLAGHRMPPNDAAQLLEQLARAIHVAHLRGIIHRDLK